jgi:uncharacterized NAD(P)/FAD-binding protein YdhS
MLEKEQVDRVGVPYATKNVHHLLNVPAGNMSALAEVPHHFTDWLLMKGYDFGPSSFVPRTFYRDYILDTFNELMRHRSKGVNVQLLQAEAVDVDMQHKAVLLKDGTRQYFDKLILATGTFASPHLPLKDTTYQQSPNYYHSAWEVNIPDRLRGDESIFIIGTGLTMTDTLISLHNAGHKGKIHALSRHGLLPAVHKKCEVYPSFGKEMEGHNTALGMFKTVRKHLQAGVEWRAVIDSLRPYNQRLWASLPDKEKQVFIKHLRHWWDAARHRMPASSADIIYPWLSEEKAVVMGGRIEEIALAEDGLFKIAYRKRYTRYMRHLEAEVIINCMGPATDYNRIQHVLVKNLLQKGLLITDPMCLGVQCAKDGALINSKGITSGCFYTIGAPAKGVLWETTAVPELRVQAMDLANKMIEANIALSNYHHLTM